GEVVRNPGRPARERAWSPPRQTHLRRAEGAMVRDYRLPAPVRQDTPPRVAGLPASDPKGQPSMITSAEGRRPISAFTHLLTGARDGDRRRRRRSRLRP